MIALCIWNVQGGWIDCRWKSIGTVSLSRKGARILSRNGISKQRRNENEAVKKISEKSRQDGDLSGLREKRCSWKRGEVDGK